ncbi:MAG TPA: hypothetical protein VFG50_04950, partial [Rhodothermales bacterium]|nr:hypothetical protein [Rhodothermales bacterium]
MLVLLLAAMSGAAVLYGCDAVQPTEDPVLVVEAFLDAGKPLPRVRLGQTTPLSQPYQGTG